MSSLEMICTENRTKKTEEEEMKQKNGLNKVIKLFDSENNFSAFTLYKVTRFAGCDHYRSGSKDRLSL